MAGTEIATLETGDRGAGLGQLSDAALAYADAGLAENTKRAFRSSFGCFASWCASVDRRPLPADATTVAEYLAARAPHLAVSTLAIHLAAIRKAHELAGEPVPAGPAIDAVWNGVRRRRGAPPKRKRALTTAQLRKLVDLAPGAGTELLRNRAILLFTFAGAFRRSEVAIMALDGVSSVIVSFVDEGALVALERGKGDQAGVGATVAVPYGDTALCPVAALRRWIEAAGLRSGYVFRRLDPDGSVAEGHVSDRLVARLVQRAGRKAGLDPTSLGGHSLRSGLATEAAKRGVALQTISSHLRHKKLETTMGYIRDGERFKRNAAGKVGL